MRKTQTKEKQKNDHIIKDDVARWGIAAGIAQAAYIILAVYSLNVLNDLMRQSLGVVSFGFILFLLFFVFSAVLTAAFVFGRPTFLLLEKKIKEAVLTLLVTVVTLLVILLFIAILILGTRGV